MAGKKSKKKGKGKATDKGKKGKDAKLSDNKNAIDRAFFDKWDSIDNEFDGTQRLEEVRQLVHEGVVSQKVFDELVKFQNEKKLGKKRAIHEDPYVEKPLIQSHLYKRTANQGALKNAHRWPKRYFVLYPSRLEYFIKKGDEKPIGIIDISKDYNYPNDHDVEKEVKMKLKPNYFILSNFVEKYYFAAESKELKTYWMHHLKLAIRKLEQNNQLTDTPLLLTSRKSSVQEMARQMKQRMASYRSSIKRMGSKNSASMFDNGSVGKRSTNAAVSVTNTRRPARNHGSNIMKGSVTGSHVRDEGEDNSVVVRLQYVEKKPGPHANVNPFDKFNTKVPADSREAPPILEVGETVELPAEPDDRDADFDEFPDSASVSLPDSLKVEDADVDKDVDRIMSTPTGNFVDTKELDIAEMEADAAAEAEGSVSPAVAEAQNAVKQSIEPLKSPPKNIGVGDMLEVEKFEAGIVDNASANAEVGSAAEVEVRSNGEEANIGAAIAGAVGAMVNGVRSSFMNLINGDDEASPDEVEPEVLNKNIEAVSKEMGLRPRSGSYQEALHTKAEEAETQRMEAIKAIEKSNMVVDVILMQDAMLKKEEALAKELGDEKKATEVAEQRKNAKEYAKEQELLAAKASMLKVDAEAVIAEKDEALAEDKAVKEIATEMSKIDAAMANAKSLQKKAEAARLKAEAAAKRVYEKAQQRGKKLATHEQKKYNEIQIAADIEEQRHQAVLEAEVALANAANTEEKRKAEQQLGEAKLAEKQAEIVRRQKEYEMKSLAAAKLEAKAKAFMVSKGLKNRSDTEDKRKSLTNTTSYKDILDNVPMGAQTSATKRMADFIANNGPVILVANSAAENQTQTEEEAVAKMKTNKYDYDDFTESYYSDEEYRDGDFEDDDADQQYFKEKTKDVEEDEIKRRSQAWVDHEVEILLGVIDAQGKVNKAGAKYIAFGELVKEYKKYSDGLAGILHKARKQGKVDYEGDIMFATESQDTIITIIEH